MPVETPRTPDFSDALEERLRRDAARGRRRRPEILPALIVVAALGGGAAFVLATAGDEPGRSADTTATTPLVPAGSGARTGRRAVLLDARTGRAGGTATEIAHAGRGDRVIRIRVYGLNPGQQFESSVGGQISGGPPVAADGTLRRDVRVRTPVRDAEVTVVASLGRQEVLRGRLEVRPGPQRRTEQVGEGELLTRSGKPRGTLSVLRQDGQRALDLTAVRLAEGSRYVVWVDDRFLGFAPPVQENGYLWGLAPLADDVQEGNRLLVTRETSERPKRPGAIVLQGRLPAVGPASSGGTSVPGVARPLQARLRDTHDGSPAGIALLGGSGERTLSVLVNDLAPGDRYSLTVAGIAVRTSLRVDDEGMIKVAARLDRAPGRGTEVLMTRITRGAGRGPSTLRGRLR